MLLTIPPRASRRARRRAPVRSALEVTILSLVVAAPGVEARSPSGAVTPPQQGSERIEIARGGAIRVDGMVTPGEWSDAAALSIDVPGTSPVRVLIKHDEERLLFAFSGLSGEPFLVPEVVIDVGNDKSESWNGDDYWFHASFTDCWGPGRPNQYDTCVHGAAGWEANNLVEGAAGDTVFPEVFELAVPFATLGVAPKAGAEIGIAFDATDTSSVWHFWPPSATLASPRTWATATILSAER